MSSEVARIRQQIAEEIRAMNRAKEFAAVARHATITHHLEKIGICVE